MFSSSGWRLLVASLVFFCIIFGFISRLNPFDNSFNNFEDRASLIYIKNIKPKPQQYTFGGRELLPYYRFIALYGSPQYPDLGVLGNQSLPDTIKKAQELASSYQPYSDKPVIPTLEIIATVASAFPGPNNNYSDMIDVNLLKSWVLEAQKAGLYIVIDLQPGRSDFLAQAKMFEPLLKSTNVGLALDPEWRIGPNQVHMVQIGSVPIQEVNSVITWLANLTKYNNLPQKMLVLHQFQLSMLPNREQLDTTNKQLAYLIQMDGQGPQAAKLDTYQTIVASPPLNTYFGWKNFYTKDPVLRTPEETINLPVKPYYISYQ